MNTANIKPLHDRVLVEFREQKPDANTLIEIPDSVYQSRQRAVVLAIGPKCDDSVCKGDIVLVSSFGGIEIEDRDGGMRKLKLFKQDELIAKL